MLGALTLLANPAVGQMPTLLPEATAPPSTPAISVFSDWRVICATRDDDHQACRIEPIAVKSETGAAPSVSILRDDDGEVLVLRAPLGLLLPQGAVLRVDGRELGRLAFQTCETDGCVAPVRLTSQIGTAIRRGIRLEIELTSRDGVRLQNTVSLLGVTAALGVLSP